MKGIILDTDYDLMIRPLRDSSGKITRGMVVADNTDQCAALVLGSSQGHFKEDLLLGVGLTKYIRSKESKSEVMQRIRQHLTRAGINYSDYKKRINLSTNT